MVTRAKATALVLVNWKGVFYERYLLDPNVTALEGGWDSLALDLGRTGEPEGANTG